MRYGSIRWLALFGAAAACLPARPQPESGPRLSTKEEYKACRLSQDDLQRRAERLDRRVDRRDAAAARLQAETSAYMVSRQKKGLKSAAEVQSYNQAVAAFNARGRALETEHAEILKERDEYNADVLSVNGSCGGKFVSQDVRDEVERELAGKGKE